MSEYLYLILIPAVTGIIFLCFVFRYTPASGTNIHKLNIPKFFKGKDNKNERRAIGFTLIYFCVLLSLLLILVRVFIGLAANVAGNAINSVLVFFLTCAMLVPVYPFLVSRDDRLIGALVSTVKIAIVSFIAEIIIFNLTSLSIWSVITKSQPTEFKMSAGRFLVIYLVGAGLVLYGEYSGELCATVLKIKQKTFFTAAAAACGLSALYWIKFSYSDNFGLGYSHAPSYRLLAIAGLLSLILIYRYFDSFKKVLTKRKANILILFFLSIVFGFFVSISNYPVYEKTDGSIGVGIVLLGISGSIVFATVVSAALLLSEKISGKAAKLKTSFSPSSVYWFSFVFACLIYLGFLFVCFWPGGICSDSQNQLSQIINGEYSNHHPYYHTQFMRIFFTLGLKLYGNVTDAIGIITVAQCIIMAATFAYMLSTLSECNVPTPVLAVVLLYLTIIPPNLYMALTIWKDTLFTAGIVIFLTSLLRILKKFAETPVQDYVLLCIGALAMCLFRTNGSIAFALTLVVVVFIFRKTNKKVIYCLCAVFIVSMILKYPVLAAQDIPQHDTVEGMSVPMQQISRTIVDKNDLDAEDMAFLNNFMDTSRIAETYNPGIYDYIRDLIRNEGDQEYLKNNMVRFYALWLKVGLTHPLEYMKAWVDQTNGYVNPSNGYHIVYWYWILESDVDVYQSDKVIEYQDNLTFWRDYYATNDFGKFFVNPGLAGWFTLILFAVLLLRKSRGAIFTIPSLALIATMLLAALIATEFRLGYPITTLLPFIACLCFFDSDIKEIKKPD